MWLSQFASNLGGWMQTVGAQCRGAARRAARPAPSPAADQERRQRVENLLSAPPQVTHLIADDAGRHHVELRDSPAARRMIAEGDGDGHSG
jgi:hypothetical protein